MEQSQRNNSVVETTPKDQRRVPRDSGDTMGIYEADTSNDKGTKHQNSSSVISIKHNQQYGGGLIMNSFDELQVSDRTPVDSEPAELVTTPVHLSKGDAVSAFQGTTTNSQINRGGSLVDAIMKAAERKRGVANNFKSEA